MKQIELLLTENVDNLGIVGDVVKVKPGFARNYLVPRGIGIVPTPEAVEALAEQRKKMAELMEKQRADQAAMIEKLDGYELTIERSANEQGVLFGGVSQHDISEALQAEGYDVEDRFVRIGEQIKRLDTYTIPIHISHELKAEIKLWVVSDKAVAELEAEDAEGQVEGEVVEEGEASEAADTAETEKAEA